VGGQRIKVKDRDERIWGRRSAAKGDEDRMKLQSASGLFDGKEAKQEGVS
jgi:hypothetical protein